MKSKHPFLICLAVAGMIAITGLCQTATALSYTWDLSNTAGIQTGSGTWSTTDTNWSTDGTTLTGWLQTNATTSLHTATFAGADGTHAIAIGEGVSAQTLTFSNSGYTLSAVSDQTVTLTNAGSGIVTIASGKSATIGNNATVRFTAASNTGTRVDLTTGGTLDIAAGGLLTRTGQVTSGFSTTGGTLGFMGSGTVNVAGTLSFNVPTPNASGGIVLAANATNSNILNVNGGTVSSNSTINGIALVAAGTSGTLNVNSGLVSTTGTAGVTSGVNLANGTGTTGTVNLNGGTISTYQINSNYYNGSNVLTTGGTSTFNFHGGTLKAIANNTSFMGGLSNAFIKSNGAVIDTNGFNVVIAQQLKTDTVSLGGGLTKQGAGTLTLTGANTYTGGTSVNQGAVAIGNNTAFGTGAVAIGNNTSVSNSATLSGLANTFTGSGSFTTGTGQVTIAGNWSGFSGAVTTSANADMVFNGAFSSGVSVTTSENAAYVNNYNLNNSNGMIVQNQTGTTGTYKMGSYASAAGSNLRNAGSATGSVIFVIGNLGADTTVAGTIGGGAQTVSLTKVGSGTLTLGGANTYTGTTTVSAGTLALGLSGTISNTLVMGSSTPTVGTLDVTAKSSFTQANVSGNGTLNIGPGKAISVTGALSPGFSPGTINVTGDLTLTDTTTTTSMELAGNGGVEGMDSDDINVSGTITLDGLLSIVGFGGYDITQNAAYNLFDATTFTGDFDGVSVGGNALSFTTDVWSGSFGPTTYSFSETTGVLTVVPEPAAALLGGIGLLALLRRRRV